MMNIQLVYVRVATFYTVKEVQYGMWLWFGYINLKTLTCREVVCHEGLQYTIYCTVCSPLPQLTFLDVRAMRYCTSRQERQGCTSKAKATTAAARGAAADVPECSLVHHDGLDSRQSVVTCITYTVANMLHIAKNIFDITTRNGFDIQNLPTFKFYFFTVNAQLVERLNASYIAKRI